MIQSSKNQLVKKIKLLQQKKYRDKENMFIVEGIRFLSEIPTQYPIAFYAASDTFQNKNDISEYKKRAEVFVFSDEIFQMISETEHSQGILAVCQKQEAKQKLQLQKNGFYLLAEQIQDPGNLGTIIRTADACGVNGIFLSKGCVDLYNSKVLRSTMGSIFHLPIMQNVDLSECIEQMKQNQIAVLAAHLDAKEYPYTVNLKKGCAILIGNEGRGISQQISKKCTQLVKLPMIGQAESLNASVAAGVLLYKAVRQRI